MDTLVADPFFRGFERDVFGITGGIKQLFEVKDQNSFVAFERGDISEEEHFKLYFTDRREVDGASVRTYMSQRYEWMPGMHSLCVSLREAGVPMAAVSNYPAEWAPLVEAAVDLSSLVPWAFISGEVGHRKPSPEAYAAALAAVGRDASECIFVDDSVPNVEAACAYGITSIHFTSADALKPILNKQLGITI